MEARELPVTAALAALSCTVALAFGRVFDSGRYLAPLLAAAILPHVLGAVVRSRGGTALHAWCVWAIGLGLFALLLAHGSPGMLVDHLTVGWHVVQRDAVPIRTTDGPVLLGAIIVWLAAATADDLAFWRHASLGAVAPGALVLIWIAALGARDGQWVTISAFGVVAILFLALQHQALLERRRTRLGTRRILDAPGLVLVAVAAGVVALVAGAVAAPALPGGDRPLFEAGGIGQSRGGSYRTNVPPLLDVGDKLKQGAQQELFTVRASSPDYWRITALDQYRSVEGGQWTLTAEGDDAVSEGLDERVPRDALAQQYEIGPLGERWMPAAYRPVRVSRPHTLVVRASNTLVTGDDSVSGLRYRVTSARPPLTVTDAQRTSAQGGAPADLAFYTELPADFPEVIKATAISAIAGKTGSFDKALALRDFFRSGFTYDPTFTGGDDQSAIETFLFDKRGFCVQFASAYATMARSVGIPARVAVGFTPGTLAPDGRYHVTNFEAHAWPEVWLDGIGWTHMFDPTPPSALPGGSSLPGEPPPAETTPAPVPAGGTQPATTPSSTPTSDQPSTPTTAPPAGVTVDPGAGATDESAGGTPWLLIGLLVLALLVITPVLIVLVAKARRRARRRASPDPSAAITGAWLEAIDQLTDRRLVWPSSDTPNDLARRVPTMAGDATAAPMRKLAGSYSAVRYGADVPPPGAADDAWDQVDALRDALDASTPWLARFRARIDATTLRRQPEPAGWSLRRRSSTND